MEIKRDLYLNKLIKRECNGLVKVVTGIRRCGKSYLLFHLYHDYLLNKGISEDHLRRPFLKSLLERAEKFALPARQSGLFHKIGRAHV